MPLDPSLVRRTHRTLEPIHGMVYFTPHGPPAYAAAGLRGSRMGYFASRSAALGPVGAEVVIATFFNFNPDVVRRVIPAAWDLAPPDAVLAARLVAVDGSLRQAWGDAIKGPEVEEAAGLARQAAQRAVEQPQGRPLFAAHAQLPWPDDPHLALWHAQTLLREFRGDGHVALLASEGLGPVEALVVHAATGAVDANLLRTSRAWSEDDWSAGVDRVRARGWLKDGDTLALSAAGLAHRQSLEDRTDELALWPYEILGAGGCQQLRQLCKPLSRAVIDAGLLSPHFLAADDDVTST